MDVHFTNFLFVFTFYGDKRKLMDIRIVLVFMDINVKLLLLNMFVLFTIFNMLYVN
ncbi:hypothetical protein FH5_03682 [Priestia endophytica]|nr:hypothetical protein FH5_03682 [Priestia endophytica]